MATTGQVLPNRRRSNPLSDYPMVTYQFSLYMMTPDTYDEFITTGKTRINLATTGKGAYLIAQSGGINNTESSSRADGFKLDYYIDNVIINQAISPTSSGTSAASTEITFTITEPYGFSFITNLKRASDQISNYSTVAGMGALKNATKQIYILGVKFLGYDASGNVIQETAGMYQRFWDIYLTSIKYKLDGKAVTYSIEAAPINLSEGFGSIKGRVDLVTTVRGRTVRDVLEGNDPSSGKFGLFTKLTQDQENIPGIVEPNRYFVKFIGPDADAIANAVLKTKSDTDLTTTPAPPISSTEQSNPKTEAYTVAQLDSVELQFSGCHIMQAIQQIITQSSYLEKALTKVYKTEIEPNTNTEQRQAVQQVSDAKLKWYNVSCDVTNARFDDKTNMFAYDITYYIRSYDIPAIIVPDARSVSNYYGPVKRYEYWYSGKNSEIIKYEQTLDNSYYLVVLDPTNAGDVSDESNVSRVPNKRQDAQRSGRPLGASAESQNQIATQLTDPGNYAHAVIDIMGDPDFLIQTGANGSELTYDLFYGPDGFSINPNGGQVFIEIDFKEAIDYDSDKGVMKINDKILFWNYPLDVISSGISYRVNGVKSFFRGGKFTQTLDCTINVFGTPSESSPASASITDNADLDVLVQAPGERVSSGTTANQNVSSSDLLQAMPVAATNINYGASSTTEYDT